MVTIRNKSGEDLIFSDVADACSKLKLDKYKLLYTYKGGDSPRYQKWHKGYKLIDIGKKNKEVRTACLVGDLHFKYENKDAVDILYQVLEDYKGVIDEYIDLGDGVNNNALSSFDDTELVKYDLNEEVEAYVAHMNTVKDILNNTVKFTAVEDNHYHLRVKRFVAKNPGLAGMLKDIDFKFDEQVPHGKLYYPFGQNRVGMIHGIKTSKYVTANTLMCYQSDIIHAHTHSSQHYTAYDGLTKQDIYPRKGWGVPSMCTQMEYVNGKPSRQNTGFVFLVFDKKTNNYSMEYIFVEKGVAIFRGKKYTSRLEK